MLTISTAPLTALGTGIDRETSPWRLLGAGLLAALLIAPLYRRRAWPAFAFALTLVATGCASSADPPSPQTYAVTVTAKGRSASQSVLLDLTITG